MVECAVELRTATGRLKFRQPVTHVYHPLEYAWAAYERYLLRFAGNRKRVLFLGMNPGPFGMVQTGIPFGEITAVRDWLGITAPVSAPPGQNPHRPVLGFSCQRSEVSGRRLWNFFAKRFGTAESFFAAHFVANYCPLAFFEASGRNRTPDKLPAAELGPVLAACDAHLRGIVELLEPEWVIGIGRFAEERVRTVLAEGSMKIGCILHPSPASPAANGDWEGKAQRQLEQLGVW